MADIWLFTMVSWLEGLPARASSYPPAAQIVALGWTLPTSLSAWAEMQRHRPEIVDLT
jgi:hypothetical protein